MATQFYEPRLIARDAFQQGVDASDPIEHIEAWIVEELPDLPAPDMMASLVRFEIETNREAWLDEPVYANAPITYREYFEDMKRPFSEGGLR